MKDKRWEDRTRSVGNATTRAYNPLNIAADVRIKYAAEQADM